MNISVRRESTTTLLHQSEQWLFVHHYNYEHWFTEYSKVTRLVKNHAVVGIEYHLTKPSLYRTYLNRNDVTVVRLESPPLPNDVVTEFREQLADITSRLLAAPLKNT